MAKYQQQLHSYVWQQLAHSIEEDGKKWLEDNRRTEFGNLRVAEFCMEELRDRIIRRKLAELQELGTRVEYPLRGSFACDYASKTTGNKFFCTHCPLTGFGEEHCCYDGDEEDLWENSIPRTEGILYKLWCSMRDADWVKAADLCLQIAALRPKTGVET